VWAVPEEARPGAGRVGLGAEGAGRRGPGRGIGPPSPRGGRRGAGDQPLLVAHRAAGGALSHADTRTYEDMCAQSRKVKYKSDFFLIGLNDTNVLPVGSGVIFSILQYFLNLSFKGTCI